jgi:hypothetical protein
MLQRADLLSVQHIAFLVFRENLHEKDFSTGVDLLSFQILVLSVEAFMASYRTYFVTVL